MQDLFTQFFNLYNGQPVEKEDPSNPDQCMDLIFAWCDFLKIPRETVRHEFAYQVWQYPTAITYQYFDLIPNGLTNVPKVGSIIVFGTKVGSAGHVSIETGKSNLLNANSFDQNWDTAHYNLGVDPKTGKLIPYSRLVTHNLYSGVLGWLQPKVQNSDDKLCSDLQALFNSGGSSTSKIASDIALLKQYGKI